MNVLLAVGLTLLLLQIHGTAGQGPLEEQNLDGDLVSPRSNVVMQSVVLGRRRPRYCDDDDCDCEWRLRRLLRRLYDPYPLPMKRAHGLPATEEDPETIDAETVQSLVKKARRRRQNGDDLADMERLLGLGRRNRSRKANGGRHKPWRRRRREEDSEDVFPRRRRAEEDDDEIACRRRRLHKRRGEWDEKEEEKPKRTIDEDSNNHKQDPEWGLGAKDPWSRKHLDGTDLFYLPQQYSQTKHVLRPQTAEEFVR